MIDYSFSERTAQDIEAAAQSDEALRRLWRDMRAAAIRYAHLRSQWMLADPEGRSALDRERIQAHNAFISTCDALSRNMAQRGHPIDWRKSLGDAASPEGRKIIGDFACFLHCIAAISAR